MPYFGVNPYTLYYASAQDWEQSGAYDPMACAQAWVRAEMVHKMWGVIEQYFKELPERGVSSERYTPIDHCPGQRIRAYEAMQQALAYHASNVGVLPEQSILAISGSFLDALDADFALEEKKRFRGRKAPEFWRMDSMARVGFVKAILPIIKTSGEIRKEAEQRVGAGEELPPSVEEAA